jgi:hypothetical protein
VKVMSSGFDGIAPYVSFYTPGTTTWPSPCLFLVLL